MSDFRRDEMKDEEVPVWRACTETQPRLREAARDEVVITVRDPDRGGNRTTERYFLPFPTAVMSSRLILRRDGQGKLYSAGS